MTPTEINEAVARKLGHSPHDVGMCCPNYCTSIAAAWEIVESLAKENERKGGGPILTLSHDGKWHFRIGNMGTTLLDNRGSQADTAPMAICLAFLKMEGK